eukprot:scaffold1257_cov140-Skeletonema_menzelii.AAC.4
MWWWRPCREQVDVDGVRKSGSWKWRRSGGGDGGLNAQRRGYSGTNSYTSEEILSSLHHECR